MPRTLILYTFAERTPSHGMDVFYLHVSPFYGSVEPRLARVEYSWFEVDEHGDHTGNQVLYDPETSDHGNNEAPEGCVLRVLLIPEGDGAFCPEPDMLWCPASDLDALHDCSDPEDTP